MAHGPPLQFEKTENDRGQKYDSRAQERSLSLELAISHKNIQM